MTQPVQVVNLGTCWGTPGGQDLSSPSYMAAGLQCVGEAVARRWTTSPGELIDDADYGRNLQDLLSADLTPADIAYEQQQLAAEAQKDERVRSAVVTLVLDVAGQLSAVANIVTAAGPFRLVVTVSQVDPTTLTVTT